MLTWPQFRSQYSRTNPGASSSQASRAWKKYKSENGLSVKSTPKRRIRKKSSGRKAVKKSSPKSRGKKKSSPKSRGKKSLYRYEEYEEENVSTRLDRHKKSSTYVPNPDDVKSRYRPSPTDLEEID